jgi:hypothetical protein
VEYVEFAVNDAERFQALCTVFEALKHDKDAGVFREDAEWFVLFDQEVLSHFWWPSAEELAEFRRRWEAASVEERFSDPSFLPPAWDFLSMIDAFKNGEYEFLACRMITADRARLEFNSFAYPYGGTASMKALIEAFGFTVTGEDDGTGYQLSS